MDHPSDGLILIVDDNPASLGVLCNLLTGAGFSVAVATDGAMAIEHAHREPPDLVLLDIGLPDISGFEVCRQLKADPATREITVMFMTAFTDTKSKLQALRQGAVDYITKPLEGEEVLARIHVHMQLQALTRKLARTNQHLADANDRLSKENEQRASAEAALTALAQELEQRIEERTDDLSRALAELEQVRAQILSANDALKHEAADRAKELDDARERLREELAERVRAERARTELQEEIILMQRAALAELSTPLIPITEHIMVMPMIGTLGEERAQQMLDAALGGVHQHGARVVILDVTGLKAVDTDVAGTLVRMSNALRLLGAQAVITGIRPDLAQMLIAEDVDLAGVTTRGTLKGGIAYALAQSGDRVGLLRETLRGAPSGGR
jgi:DNA-binding response OmpR family regulator/anti-anti-sigma regulatory factor